MLTLDIFADEPDVEPLEEQRDHLDREDHGKNAQNRPQVFQDMNLVAEVREPLGQLRAFLVGQEVVDARNEIDDRFGDDGEESFEIFRVLDINEDVDVQRLEDLEEDERLRQGHHSHQRRSHADSRSHASFDAAHLVVEVRGYIVQF